MTRKSALVVIGNEILSGRTQDANTGWIGEKMAAHGVPLAEVRVVPDVEEKIVEAVNTLRGEYDYVFTTGGIGPTHDDITAESVAKAFGLPFEQHEGAYETLVDYYGKDQLTEARVSMVMMPRGAVLIPNPVSGAPGFNIENVYVMAGVPRIMQAMLDSVLALISPGEPILCNTVSCDLPESVLAEGLSEIQDAYLQVDIGSYPAYRNGKPGGSLVLRSTERQPLAEASKKVMALVQELGGMPQALEFQVEID